MHGSLGKPGQAWRRPKLQEERGFQEVLRFQGNTGQALHGQGKMEMRNTWGARWHSTEPYTVDYCTWTRTARKYLPNIRQTSIAIGRLQLARNFCQSGRPAVPIQTEHLGLTTVHRMLLSRKELLN